MDKGRTTDKIYENLCKGFDKAPRKIFVSELERHGDDGWTN